MATKLEAKLCEAVDKAATGTSRLPNSVSKATDFLPHDRWSYENPDETKRHPKPRRRKVAPNCRTVAKGWKGLPARKGKTSRREIKQKKKLYDEKKWCSRWLLLSHGRN